MNVEEWDPAFAAACLGTVNGLLKDCGPSDFVARHSLESHRDELAARVASAEAPRDTDSPSTAQRRQMPCRLCRSNNTPALAVFALSDGCVAEPDDREQALCGQHIMGATPHGSMELTEVLRPEAYAEFMQFWTGRTGARLLTPEESEADGRGRGGGVWSSKPTPEDR